MHLGLGVENTLHACVLLALLPSGRSLPAAKLAEYHEVPAAQLAKNLQALAAAGVLVSVRGRSGGGYKLARPAEQVSLLDIVDAVEGAEPIFRCAGIRFRGPCATGPDRYAPMCTVTAAMREAEQAWRNALAGCSVADLVCGTGRQAVPEVVANSSAWLQRSMH